MSFGIVLVLASCFPSALNAQTALVWDEDPAYADLDVLRAPGLAEGIVFSQRPYSQAAFTRMVGEARAALPADASARVLEALERLEARFGTAVEEAPAAAVRDAAASLTWSRSPDRSAWGGIGGFNQIDADVNPLLDARRGRLYAIDGATTALEGGAEVRLGSGVAAYVRPRVWWAQGRGEAESEADATLQAAYLRAVLANLAVEVGRVPTSLGQGRFGGPVLSRNARALDMVRLSPEQAFQLPWIFGRLGPFHPSILLADMGGESNTPNSKLVVMRIAWRATPGFEFGATLLNHQAGENTPDATFWERVQDVFLWGMPGFELLEFSDKVAGVDFRWTFPERGLELYLDGATTDFNMARFHEMLWDEAAWVAGMRLTGLGTDERTDLWMEGQRTGVRMYTHHQYTSGLTVDRRVIGDPIGPMATGWAAGVDWNGAATRVSFEGAWERYRGDVYRGNGEQSGDFRLEVVSDEPDEIRLRGLVGLEHRRADSGLRAALRLGAERVTRFNWTDEGRTNWLAEVVLGWEG